MTFGCGAFVHRFLELIQSALTPEMCLERGRMAAAISLSLLE